MPIKEIKRPYYRIKQSDIQYLADDELIKITTTGENSQSIVVKVRHIRDRYERGIGTPGGRPSVDWMENGEHKSTTGIPQWLINKAEEILR